MVKKNMLFLSHGFVLLSGMLTKTMIFEDITTIAVTYLDLIKITNEHSMIQAHLNCNEYTSQSKMLMKMNKI